MFLFVVLTLFTDWIWVDATEEISAGLPYTDCKLQFIDLDEDGDEDLIRLNDDFHADSVEAYENILTETGRRWLENPDLLDGITNPYHATFFSLGAGDLNNDGREELIIHTEEDLYPMKAFVNTGEPGDPYWELDTTLLGNTIFAKDPDFADVDGDGDLDMMGQVGWDPPETWLWWNQGTAENPDWEQDSSYFDFEWLGYAPTPPPPAWIDWNQDGLWDVITADWAYCDPPPNSGEISVQVNNDSGLEPDWQRDVIMYLIQIWHLELTDWNQDDIPDMLLGADEWFSGYRLYPGSLNSSNEVCYQSPPIIWGGLYGSYPAVEDLNADQIPEITVAEMEYQIDIWGGGWIYPAFSSYSSLNQYGTTWQLDGRGGWYDYLWAYKTGHCQYVDLNNDGLLDCAYVYYKHNYDSTIVGEYVMNINTGTLSEPAWKTDSSYITDLPPLFPTCFLDIDGDGDKDIIGYAREDSTISGFRNTGSYNDPDYEQDDELVSGLESIKPTFISQGDITDNDLDLTDLAVGIVDGNLTAFFNTGQENPRWQRHDEVFSSLDVAGNPCLCDADDDDDLDLYLVTDGRLHFYRNESTGGIAETSPDPKPVAISHVGSDVELKLIIPDFGPVQLKLYDSAGRMVERMIRRQHAGEVLFRISERPGVYFYQINTGKGDFSGKIVIF